MGTLFNLSGSTGTITYAKRGPGWTISSSLIGFVNLTDQDVFFSDVDLWSSQTLILTATDSYYVGQNYLANASGSNSSYAYFAHGLLQNRAFVNRFPDNVSSVTGSLTSYLKYFRTIGHETVNDTKLGLGDVGVIAVKKIKYGENIRPNSFTASCSGIAGTEIAFVDSVSADETWGYLTRKSDGASAGIIMYDIGVALIHGPSITAIQSISSVTSVKFQSTYRIKQLNAFCTATPEQLRYTQNDSAFYMRAVTSSPFDLQDDSLTSYASYGYEWGNSDMSTSADRGGYFLKGFGTDWGPMITTIGLYNDANELLAVAKTAQPIKKPSGIPITMRVSIDFD